ncbi:MAG: Aminopeptidase [Bacteroidota bacterium]|nr:Aminopeptidase [Bacteroidota bacterium]
MKSVDKVNDNFSIRFFFFFLRGDKELFNRASIFSFSCKLLFFINLVAILFLFSDILAFSRDKYDKPLAVPVSSPTNYIPQAFDVISYDAEIDFTKAPSRDMKGVCRILLDWIQPPDTNKFYFHLRSLRIDSAFYENVKVQPVEVETPESPTYHFEIPPPSSISLSRVTITIYYSGTMTDEKDNPGVGGVASNGGYMYSIGVGSRNNYVSACQHWLPCYDLPSDKAAFHCRFKVADSMAVASNGNLNIENIGDGAVIYDWQHDYPASTYLLSFAVGNYIPVRDTVNNGKLPVVFYSKPSDTNNTRIAVNNIKIFYSLFDSLFGAYPFEKIGYVEVPQSGYCMEHQTMISIVSPLISNQIGYKSTRETLAHELAHQWFGDAVTCLDFRDAWLNESFATFCEALYNEASIGHNAYISKLDADKSLYLNQAAAQGKEGILSIYDFEREAPSTNYPVVIYYKGSVVMGMLRYEMGDSIFFKTMRAYYEKFKYQNVSTKMMKDFFEESSGKNLNKFFDNWIYQKGWPILKIQYSKEIIENDYYKVRLHIIQEQEPDRMGTYSHFPLEIGFYTINGKYDYRVIWIESPDEIIEIDSVKNFTTVNVNQGPTVRIIMQLDELTSIAENSDISENRILIYPNPAFDKVNISLVNTDRRIILNNKIEIYNSIGKLAGCYNLDNKYSITIETSSLPSGIYFIKFSADNYSAVKSVIIEH